VPLRNCGLVVEDADGGGGARGAKKRQAEGATIHRIEAATAFDFARVKHLLFSPPEAAAAVFLCVRDGDALPRACRSRRGESLGHGKR
jgi:hypothetical protein